MQNLTAFEIEPDQPILINEAAAATGLTARKINRLIDDSILPKSVCIKLGTHRALRAFAVPMAAFAASDGVKLSKTTRLDVMRLIEQFTTENWSRLRDKPEHAKGLCFESGCVTVSLGESVGAAMVGLNKWADALRRVHRDSEIRGGAPVVRGTRIGVYEVADAFATEGLETMLEDFPTLTPEDVEAAALYAKGRPRSGRPRARTGRRRLISKEIVDLPTVG